jgi:hypothetical protein
VLHPHQVEVCAHLRHHGVRSFADGAADGVALKGSPRPDVAVAHLRRWIVPPERARGEARHQLAPRIADKGEDTSAAETAGERGVERP